MVEPAKLVSDISFWVFLAGSVGAAALAGARGPVARSAGGFALAAGLVMVGGICAQTGRPPLSGTLESLGFIAFLVAGLAFLSQNGAEANPRLARMSWLASAIILAILAVVPRQVNPDWFIYGFFFTRAFFFCRLVAMSILLYSALAALAASGEQRRQMLGRSRRFLILGTAIFLLGEVSGFYWCLNWRGDYWLWNRNFLESTMIFLLSSAALHLPPKLAADQSAQRLAYGLPGLLAVGAYMVHQVTEAFLS